MTCCFYNKHPIRNVWSGLVTTAIQGLMDAGRSLIFAPTPPLHPLSTHNSTSSHVRLYLLLGRRQNVVCAKQDVIYEAAGALFVRPLC